jgi:hypothetical protein
MYPISIPLKFWMYRNREEIMFAKHTRFCFIYYLYIYNIYIISHTLSTLYYL